MDKSKLKNMFKLVPDKKKRYFQAVPEVQKVAVAPPGYGDEAAPSYSEVEQPLPCSSASGTSMFPNDMVLYKDEFRNFVISTDYDSSLIRPLPIFYVAIGMPKGEANQTATIPITLHHGVNKSGPVYGYVEAIERNTQGTLLNHAYNPSAPFAQTKLDIGAHITREFCAFEFSVPNPADPRLAAKQTFKWKQFKSSPEVLELAKTRAMPEHDWCMLDRKNERGMKLLREDTGEVLGVYVAGKNHSRMNPLGIAAKVRWMESETWTEELKLAAFLALLAYGEKTRRTGTGGAF